MPLIVDANVAGEVFAAPPGGDFEPVFRALHQRRAVATYGGRLRVEYQRAGRRLMRLVNELARQGAVRRADDRAVDQRTEEVAAGGLCVSNDPHIIALAQVTGARLLCSRDHDLHADFRNPDLLNAPRGRVYQSRAHERLLRRTDLNLL